MGVLKIKQPKLLKEFIWPTKMIRLTTDTFGPFAAFPQDAAQAASDPTVQHRKRPLMAMLEILKPSFKRSIHVHRDDGKTITVAASGLGSDGVFEFLQTLLTRPPCTSFKKEKPMKTSYFAKKTASADPNAVSIARWPPRWWTTGRRYIALAPSADLLKRSKAGLPWPEFVKEYQRDVLDKLDPAKVAADLGADAILLCWEKPGEDCHRRLVAEWLEKSLNIKVDEL